MSESRYNNALDHGQGGGTVLTTSQVDGQFGGLKIVTESVIASWTTSLVNGNDLVGVTLSAGDYIPARFDSITLTSGVAIAYNRYGAGRV
jgi:hypothetical protein